MVVVQIQLLLRPRHQPLPSIRLARTTCDSLKVRPLYPRTTTRLPRPMVGPMTAPQRRASRRS